MYVSSKALKVSMPKTLGTCKDILVSLSHVLFVVPDKNNPGHDKRIAYRLTLLPGKNCVYIMPQFPRTKAWETVRRDVTPIIQRMFIALCDRIAESSRRQAEGRKPLETIDESLREAKASGPLPIAGESSRQAARHGSESSRAAVHRDGESSRHRAGVKSSKGKSSSSEVTVPVRAPEALEPDVGEVDEFLAALQRRQDIAQRYHSGFTI